MERHSKTSMNGIQMFKELKTRTKLQEMAHKKVTSLEQSTEETETRFQRELQEEILLNKEVTRKYEVAVGMRKIEV